MIQNIKKFLIKNYKTIIKISIGLIILYWVIFFLTPKIQMSSESKSKIDSINNSIKTIEVIQKKMDSNIVQYNKEILNVDKKISDIKIEKTIIKEIYHEKIISVDNFNDIQIDSFFANRYQLYRY
jgi:septal ring factor EnvC (AmiA/AmiB activator)